jgi:AmiR/NasT family two-component response regulator
MPDVIGQAEAVIRRRFGIDSAAAYALLVKLSWQQERPIEAIARELVGRDAWRPIPTIKSAQRL